MPRLATLLIASACCAACAFAQPTINTHGVLNAASYMPPGLAAGSIAQGSVFSIFGANLGPATSAQVSQFPLGSTFQGVSIQILQGKTAVAAIPIYVSAAQINAIMPSNAPLGHVSVIVSYQSVASNPSPVTVASASPGIFSIYSGIGPGAIQNYVSASQQPVNTTVQTAIPGQTVILWATGLGPVPYADNIAPAAGNLPTKVEVFVGGQPATVAYSGRSPCCSGVDQIVFTVPANALTGCYVPVQVRTGGLAISNTVTMAISAGGGACLDSYNLPEAVLTIGGDYGLLALARVQANPAASATYSGTLDYAFGAFAQFGPNPLFFSPIANLPPIGDCTAYQSATELEGSGPFVNPLLAPWTISAQPLIAGPVTIQGSGTTTMSIAPGAQPIYFTQGPLNQTTPAPSQYTFIGPGASGPNSVGPFQTTVAPAAPLTWTNQSSVSPIPRASGFTVNWTGAGTLPVLIMGQGVDTVTDSIGAFVCLADGSAGSFTVPATVLANVPVTRASSTTSGEVILAVLPTSTASIFQATGLSAGVAVALSASATAVAFQ